MTPEQIDDLIEKARAATDKAMGIMSMKSDTILALCEQLKAVTEQRDALRELLAQADKRIVWESHGLGNNFADAVDAALGGSDE